MTQQTPAAVPAPFRLSRMISSLWVPQAIHTAAALGLADAMAAGPRTSDDLAAAVGAHPGALQRLLRGLVALELCTTTDDGRFELTDLGSCLRSDTRDSVRAWALLMGDRVWLSWSRLLDCVRTGDSVPALEGKASPFDDMTANPGGTRCSRSRWSSSPATSLARSRLRLRAGYRGQRGFGRLRLRGRLRLQLHDPESVGQWLLSFSAVLGWRRPGCPSTQQVMRTRLPNSP